GLAGGCAPGAETSTRTPSRPGSKPQGWSAPCRTSPRTAWARSSTSLGRPSPSPPRSSPAWRRSGSGPVGCVTGEWTRRWSAPAAVLPPRTSGDAAVVLVLKRLDDARNQGDPVLAVLDEGGAGDLVLGDGGLDLGERFGVAHAAHALLHVAAGVAAVGYGVR